MNDKTKQQGTQQSSRYFTADGQLVIASVKLAGFCLLLAAIAAGWPVTAWQAVVITGISVPGFWTLQNRFRNRGIHA